MNLRILLLIIALPYVGGCCWTTDRQLDEEFPEKLQVRLKAHLKGTQDSKSYDKLVTAGDIIVFRSGELTSGGSFMWGAASGDHSHAAIVVSRPDDPSGTPRVLTARSNDGVLVESIPKCSQGRDFYVYSFPEETINPDRLARFAFQAATKGTLDYDYSSAFLGLNSSLTPNSNNEISDEYTCATVVAAALHFSGISLDRAYCWWQHVSPDDLIYGFGLRNQNYKKK